MSSNFNRRQSRGSERLVCFHLDGLPPVKSTPFSKFSPPVYRSLRSSISAAPATARQPRVPCTSAIRLENHFPSICSWPVLRILVINPRSASSYTQERISSTPIPLSFSLYNGLVRPGSRPPPMSISLSKPLAFVGTDTFDW